MNNPLDYSMRQNYSLAAYFTTFMRLLSVY